MLLLVHSAQSALADGGAGGLAAAPGSNVSISMGGALDESAAVAECKKVGRFMVMGNGTTSEGVSSGAAQSMQQHRQRRRQLRRPLLLSCVGCALLLSLVSVQVLPSPLVLTPRTQQRRAAPCMTRSARCVHPSIPHPSTHAYSLPPCVLARGVPQGSRGISRVASSIAMHHSSSGMRLESDSSMALPSLPPLPPAAHPMTAPLPSPTGHGAPPSAAASDAMAAQQPAVAAVLPGILACVAGLMDQTNAQQEMLQVRAGAGVDVGVGAACQETQMAES